jgi:predicted DNA-binding transcriptional regulator YafY
MVETFARLLELLSALQARPHWTGPELAGRLGVTVRTVRRDIDRLRALGYAVDSDTGAHGGYQLSSGGAALPPLLLDDDEALALALCVRAAAGDSVVGVGDAAGRALAKLEQSMPTRLRGRLRQVTSATTRLPTQGDEVDIRVLTTVSRACRDCDALTATYRTHHGAQSQRHIEPFRIVNAGRRWYLVAHDSDLVEWRTFRLDRIRDAEPTGRTFARRDPPDPVEFVQHAITAAPYRYQAVVDFEAPAQELATLMPSTIGALEPLDASMSRLTIGANDLDYLAMQVARLRVPFYVREPVELRDRIAELAQRLAESVFGSVFAPSKGELRPEPDHHQTT